MRQITQRQIQEAASILRSGGIIALPSETVYGLGARADDELAVARIFELKGRPEINPLISHCADLEMARKYVKFSPLAEKIAGEFWPGALTLVLPRKSDVIAPNVSAGLDTLAIRVPAHPVFHQVINALGMPVAAPSANRSGRLSPTRAEHVQRDFGENLDMILDDGPTNFGLESTVLWISGDDAKILRHGAISSEILEAFLGFKLADDIESQTPKSPGQLLRHYAPKSKLVLNASKDQMSENDYWLGFGDGSEFDLSPNAKVEEAAHNLFDFLSKIDAIANDRAIIYVAPIPNNGIGVAINDRLNRAQKSTVKS